MNMKLTALAFVILAFVGIEAVAQCKIDNRFFQAGEQMTYDLYFKYGLLYKKAGKSYLKVSADTYNGESIYKASLIAKSEGVVRKVFSLEDTLTSYMTRALVPLEFHKNAHEGKEHTIERAVYTYENGKTNVHVRRVKNDELRFDEKHSANSCIYDMISVVYYARTLDYSKMKVGEEYSVDFMSGKKKAYMVIEFQGVETIEANDKKKYSCIKLVLSIANGNKLAFDNKEEAMKVYITNDSNRMPVRLDSKLRIGSTRAILKSYQGNRYPVEATR